MIPLGLDIGSQTISAALILESQTHSLEIQNDESGFMKLQVWLEARVGLSRCRGHEVRLLIFNPDFLERRWRFIPNRRMQPLPVVKHFNPLEHQRFLSPEEEPRQKYALVSISPKCFRVFP